jgi:hypothetical protein
MPRNKETSYRTAELVPFEPSIEITVLPPNSGVIGRFLEETANMFKARAMRMGGLLARINESGQRTERMLRMGAERMEAVEARLEQDLRKQGLIVETDQNNGTQK